MSLDEWMRLTGVPMFRNRLEPDYLSRVPDFRADFVKTIHNMGKTGPFWTVG